ncbi:DUF6894 family protein [Methylobacterium soli]|nr:hypothetical protein AEGHOMDF_6108 [Methylobacterium soli]
MPQYFFHLRSRAATQRDEIGSEFSDLDAAYLDTCQAITSMAAELSHACFNPEPYAFDITDQDGKLLMEVPFTEMLNRARTAPSPPPPPSEPAVPPQVARARRLAGEIADQVKTLRRNLLQSCALVAQPRIATGLHQSPDAGDPAGGQAPGLRDDPEGPASAGPRGDRGSSRKRPRAATRAGR